MDRAKLIDALPVISDWEKRLRDAGYHIGVTGSALYGMGSGKDLDVIVYPHIYTDEPKHPKEGIEYLDGEFKPPGRLAPKDICNLLLLSEPRPCGEDDGYSGDPWIWKGDHPLLGRVDVMFLRGNTECKYVHDSWKDCMPEDFET